MWQYLVGVGSNLGDKFANIQRAKDLLEGTGVEVIRRSDLIPTQPFGGVATETFLNAAWVCHSANDPETFLQTLLNTEKTLGRSRNKRWDNRPIDLDLLLAVDHEGRSLSYSSDQLKIPHPELHTRTFVLIPAVQIAADWYHPELKRTIKELYESL
jgi:2-amino-4-hydroxy-6-hydroxymethyldihydropteridine diphosphokinase